ncbi:MAG: response regulator [Acidobacteria bacterium]|nr:response regulator [Acidobacteriota bacterium]MCA1651534.1 response regulator [Acidobacteriota bacterium]
MDTTRQPLVLVLDDDLDTRELYRLVFELTGYRIVDAATVAECVRLVSTLRPHALVTDWLLPDGDGLALCAQIHRAPATRRTPILAVTGVSLSPEVIERARTLGCARFMEKPVDPEALVEAVTTLVDAVAARDLRAAAVRIRHACARVRHADRAEPSAADLRTAASDLIARAQLHARASIALMVADDSAHYVAANRASSALTGYDQSELIGLSVWDLTPPGTADARGLWNSFIASGSQEGRYCLKRRDGQSVAARYVAFANIAPGLHLSAIQATAFTPQPLSR